jgi:hypothetical protein
MKTLQIQSPFLLTHNNKANGKANTIYSKKKN